MAVDTTLTTTILNIQDQAQVLNSDEYQKLLDEHNIATENIGVLTQSIRMIEQLLGLPLENLETTAKENLVAAINSILVQVDFNVVVGALSALDTTAKENIVAAINELVEKKLDTSAITGFMHGLLIGVSNSTEALTALGAAPADHGHDASDITSGTFPPARIPNIDATKVTSGVFDPARIPVIVNNNVVSSGGISDLDPGQQADITTASIVITTDGRRWIWQGSGSKTDEFNYIEMASTNPPWSAISDKPTEFPPENHAASKVTSGVFTEARIPTTFTTARTFAHGTAVNGSLSLTGANAYIQLQDRADASKPTHLYTTSGTFYLGVDNAVVMTVPKSAPAVFINSVTSGGTVQGANLYSPPGSGAGLTLGDRSNGTRWQIFAEGGALKFWYFDGTSWLLRGELNSSGLLRAMDVGVL